MLFSTSDERMTSMTTSDNDCIEDNIRRNIGRIVIVFTKSGGASGCGFTGLLQGVDNGCIRLTSTLPAPPPHPFPICNMGGRSNVCGIDLDDWSDFDFDDGFRRRRRRRRFCGHRDRHIRLNPFGSTTRIPINQVVALVTTEP